jgi:hypothetical protein
VFVVPSTSSFPSENPCTGDPGIVSLNETYVFRISTFPDGSAHFNIHGEGTFDFDATNPAAPDFFSASERPTNIQVQLDVSGNGTQTQVEGYDATGTDGSGVLVHEVFHFVVVGFIPSTPTLEHFDLHCS